MSIYYKVIIISLSYALSKNEYLGWEKGFKNEFVLFCLFLSNIDFAGGKKNFRNVCWLQFPIEKL